MREEIHPGRPDTVYAVQEPFTKDERALGFRRRRGEEKTAVLTLLRSAARRWKPKKLAATLQITPKQFQQYMQGEEEPSWVFLFEVACVLEMPLSVIQEFRITAHELGRLAGSSEPFSQGDPDLWEFGSQYARMYVQHFGGDPRIGVPSPVHRKSWREESRDEERRRAGEVFDSLRGLSHSDLLSLPGERKELRNWAVCERLCQESAHLAAQIRRNDRDHELSSPAEGLVELALRIACLTSAAEEWMLIPLREYAWAHVGNVRRASRNPLGAEEAFFYSDEHYLRGWDMSSGPLDASRPFLFKAMHRRDQGCIEDAKTLLRLAEPLASPDDPLLPALMAELQTLDLQSDHRLKVTTLRKAIRETMRAAKERVTRGESVAVEVRKELKSLLRQFEASGGSSGLILAAKLFHDLAEDDRLSLKQADMLWRGFVVLERAETSPYDEPFPTSL